MRMPPSLDRRSFIQACTWIAAAPVLAACGQGKSLPSPVILPPLDNYPGIGEPPLIVSAQELLSAQTRGAESVIVDVSDLEDYRSGHIPGAIHGWWQDTMDPNGPVYGTVLKPDDNQADPQALRRAFIAGIGVLPRDRIVVYDNHAGLYAARMVWTLRFLGYSGAAMLDGGLAAWRGMGGDVEQRSNQIRDLSDAPAVSPQGPQQSVYLSKAQLLARLSNPDLLILDVRTPAQAADDIDETIVPGTIPGAVAVPWDAAVGSDGGLRPTAELAAHYENAGLTQDRTIALLARFGVEAAHSWLVLKLLGFPNVTIYDGGWNEWALDSNTPKAPLPAR